MRFALFFLVLVMGFAPGVRAGLVEDCTQDAIPKLKLRSCELIINIGKTELAKIDNLVAFHTYQGEKNAEFGRYNRAIEEFDAAINLNPENSDLYFERGLVYWKLRKLRKALSDWRHAVELDPWRSIVLVVGIAFSLYLVFHVLLWIYRGITNFFSQTYRRIIEILSQIGCFLRAKQQAVTKAAWRIWPW